MRGKKIYGLVGVLVALLCFCMIPTANAGNCGFSPANVNVQSFGYVAPQQVLAAQQAIAYQQAIAAQQAFAAQHAFAVANVHRQFVPQAVVNVNSFSARGGVLGLRPQRVSGNIRSITRGPLGGIRRIEFR